MLCHQSLAHDTAHQPSPPALPVGSYAGVFSGALRTARHPAAGVVARRRSAAPVHAALTLVAACFIPVALAHIAPLPPRSPVAFGPPVALRLAVCFAGPAHHAPPTRRLGDPPPKEHLIAGGRCPGRKTPTPRRKTVLHRAARTCSTRPKTKAKTTEDRLDHFSPGDKMTETVRAGIDGSPCPGRKPPRQAPPRQSWSPRAKSSQRFFDLGLCVHVLFLAKSVTHFRTLTLHAAARIPPILFGPLLKPTSRGVGGAAPDS